MEEIVAFVGGDLSRHQQFRNDVSGGANIGDYLNDYGTKEGITLSILNDMQSYHEFLVWRYHHRIKEAAAEAFRESLKIAPEVLITDDILLATNDYILARIGPLLNSTTRVALKHTVAEMGAGTLKLDIIEQVGA